MLTTARSRSTGRKLSNPPCERDDEKVAALLRQLPWTHNLIILNQSQRPEEREFYLRQAIREQWSKRELERQFKTALFERTVLHPVKVTPLVSQTHPDALSVFKGSYLVEFLNLQPGHLEADLHQGLLQKLKNLLIELDRDVKKLHELYALNAAADTADTAEGEAQAG